MEGRRFANRRQHRSVWLVVVGFAVQALAGCTTKTATPPPPAVDDTAYRGTPPPPAQPPGDELHSGFSTKQKLVMLAGAAALYYMYRKHQHAAETGPDGQYYLSKNGRVYYRDAEHRAHWVTPPPGGISVPAGEAAAYRDFQGYANQSTGRTLDGLSTDQPQ